MRLAMCYSVYIYIYIYIYMFSQWDDPNWTDIEILIEQGSYSLDRADCSKCVNSLKRSAVHNFAPTVTKFCVMWEGQALPHDTKFGNSRWEIVGRRVIFIWSLIHGLRWSGLIKAEPGRHQAIIWTRAGIFFIGPLGTNYSEILIEINTFLFTKKYLENSVQLASDPMC